MSFFFLAHPVYIYIYIYICYFSSLSSILLLNINRSQYVDNLLLIANFILTFYTAILFSFQTSMIQLMLTV